MVRGVRDDQTVPEARPRPTVQYIGPAQTTLSAPAFEGSNFVLVTSPFSYAPGDVLGVTLNFDNGVVFLTTVIGTVRGDDFNPDENIDFGPDGGIQIYPPLPGNANSGNWVVNTSTPEITPDSYGSSSGG